MNAMVRNTACDREKAEAILGEEYISADYFIVTTDGREELWAWGVDEPLATNETLTSWTTPGYPPVPWGKGY